MTAEIRESTEFHDVRLGGTWSGADAIELKKTLSSIAPDTKKVRIDIADVDCVHLSCVQILLAYVRYCRGVPRPVRIEFSEAQRPQIGLWGLNASGWEQFFHGR